MLSFAAAAAYEVETFSVELHSLETASSAGSTAAAAAAIEPVAAAAWHRRPFAADTLNLRRKGET